MKFNVKLKDSKQLAITLLSVLAVLSVTFCILAMATNIFLPKQEFASLILYEGPKPVPPSTLAEMKVDGHPLFVYDTAVNNTHSWQTNYRPALSAAPVASFDFEGAPVTMEIAVNGADDLGEVVVRPLAYGVIPRVEGNVITFQIAHRNLMCYHRGGFGPFGLYPVQGAALPRGAESECYAGGRAGANSVPGAP